MKINYLLAISLLILPLCSLSQPPSSWNKWDWLTGEWHGEGSGIPGEGFNTFSFSFELDSSILVRKSHSDFSAGDFKRRVIRDEIMIIYLTNGEPENAILFNNEGHTIKYTISYKDSSIILTSEPVTNSPSFRLIYEKINQGSVKTSFEMSRDGLNFISYVEGISKKIKNKELK